MKKGDVGMAKCFSKKYGNTGMSFQLPIIRKLCQDACQHLMLYPYVHHYLQNHCQYFTILI